LAAAAAASPPIPVHAPTETIPAGGAPPPTSPAPVYAFQVNGSRRTDDDAAAANVGESKSRRAGPRPSWCHCVDGGLSRVTRILMRQSWGRHTSQRSTPSAPCLSARLCRHCHRSRRRNGRHGC
jgi:hypothetical protein